MIVSFKNKRKTITAEDIVKAGEIMENIDTEAMDRNRQRLAEALTGITKEDNIDISLTEEYDRKEMEKLNEAFDVTMKAMNENPEWFLDD